MNVLLLGATGYIGSAIDEALSKRGHVVTGAARSDAARATLAARGTKSVDADAGKPETLAPAAHAADAVVYAVSVTDADPTTVDTAALRTLVQALRGAPKALIYCSGVWYYGNTGATPATEETPPSPPALVAKRPAVERIVLDAAAQGMRAVVIRPGTVYGRGIGIPAMLVNSARQSKAAQIFGDGANHWAVVNVTDLGELFALALERAAAGSIYNANDDSTPTLLEIAQAASRGAGAGGATAAMPRETVLELLGPFGEALMLDQRVTSAKARRELGWAPTATLLEDLERGSYVTTSGG